MSEEPFFVVWQPSTGYTKYRHGDEYAATAEAERLANLHDGQEFIVLRPVVSVQKTSIVRKRFKDGDGIPF